MPISAEAPGLNFPIAAWALWCCLAGPCSPASGFSTFGILPSIVVLLGEGGPGLKLLAYLKVLSSPRLWEGKLQWDVNSASHSSLSSIVGTELTSKG